jgi:molybdopterin-guanine dinucleotide biosynthesis protein A
VSQTLQAATGEPPILIANAPEAADWKPELSVYRDAIRDCGSLGGIYTALVAGQGPVLVVAWDMPFLQVELLEEIVRRANGYDAFLPASPEARDGVEPLCSVYAPACTDVIRERIADEDFRASGFLDAVNVGTLPVDEIARFGEPDTLFFNVNSPADLNRAQELWRSVHEQ